MSRKERRRSAGLSARAKKGDEEKRVARITEGQALNLLLLPRMCLLDPLAVGARRSLDNLLDDCGWLGLGRDLDGLAGLRDGLDERTAAGERLVGEEVATMG